MSNELTELKARFDRLNLLYQVGDVIHSTLEPQEALQLILGEAVRVMRASSGSVVLVNPTAGFLEIHASRGLPAGANKLKLRVGEGITGWVARTGKPARVGDVTRDPRYIVLRRNVRSELAVPLEVNGEVRGVLNVDSDRENAFSPADQELLEELAVQAVRPGQHLQGVAPHPVLRIAHGHGFHPPTDALIERRHFPRSSRWAQLGGGERGGALSGPPRSAGMLEQGR